MVKAKYVGPVPVFLVDGSILEPGQTIEIAEHELERPDFKKVGDEDAGSAETGLYRPVKAGRKGDGSSAE